MREKGSEPKEPTEAPNGRGFVDKAAITPDEPPRLSYIRYPPPPPLFRKEIYLICRRNTVNEFRKMFFEAHEIFKIPDFVDGGIVVLKNQDKAGIDFEYIKAVAHEQYLHNLCMLVMV